MKGQMSFLQCSHVSELSNLFCPIIGYYCPEGQIVRNPSAYLCSAGYFCQTGSPSETLCPSGSYQDEAGQSTCKNCPEGFYCDSSVGPIVNYTLYSCPEGHYCPNGTKVATEFPCPAGTFTNQTGLGSDSECSDCLGKSSSFIVPLLFMCYYFILPRLFTCFFYIAPPP